MHVCVCMCKCKCVVCEKTCHRYIHTFFIDKIVLKILKLLHMIKQLFSNLF